MAKSVIKPAAQRVRACACLAGWSFGGWRWWCGGVWSSGMVLPRMVLPLLELVLRLASQSSSHEETNINTWNGRDGAGELRGGGSGRWLAAGGGRSSVQKNNYNNEKSVGDLLLTSTRCPEWRRRCAKSIPEQSAGSRAEVARCVGRCALAVRSLSSCHLRSHLCGRVSLFSAGWGRKERIGEALPGGRDWTGSTIRSSHSLLLSLQPAAFARTHTQAERTSLPQ